MTPSMYERVKNLFVAAGLTEGRIVQLLFFEDTRKRLTHLSYSDQMAEHQSVKTLEQNITYWSMLSGRGINARSLLRQCRKLLITCRTTPSATAV